MSDVHFAYEPGKTVLRGVSFEARRGEAIGIVGPFGSRQVLPRPAHAPVARAHARGGGGQRPARRGRSVRADWQRRISYVPQSPQLIWGTVAENIRFFRPGDQ